ncbi:DUF1631 family protein [Ideonella oryzae]|uniref:DUF1631 domain-containing protein n=1 Tax=Ideonella oryzae TaxID=2937441 RepID=A0ABT1BJC8_9BURK|nr:DUF1631 family protein [Ideonella oryzae]MCO5976208.1 DUF1631 domain-containing protein [Ideonella oryzae]
MNRSCNFQALWLHIVEGLPAWAGEVERGTKDSLLNSLSNPWEHAGGRGEASQALSWLKARNGVVAHALVRALAQRVKEELAPPKAPDLQMREFLLDSSPMLSLMDESSMQEGIETGRLAQQVTHLTENTLRELRSLCAVLPGRPMHEPELAYPLNPAMVAESFSQALVDLGAEPELRLPILRAGATVLGARTLQLFEQHLQWLRDQGVRPASASMRPATAIGGSAYVGIERLFSAPAGESLGAIGIAGSGVGAVAAQAGLAPPLVRKLEQLTRVLARQTHAGAAMDSVWQRLLAQVERLSPKELSALQQTSHPFWRLLDRLAALSAVQSPNDPDMRDLAARLGPMLAQLERPQELSLEAFDSALSELDSVPGDFGTTRPAELETAFDFESKRRELEPTVRAQLADQLRKTPVPDDVRQFLQGPWVQVMTHALVREGPGSPAALRYMNLVPDLLTAVGRIRRGAVPTLIERQALLDGASDGMRAAGFGLHQVEGHVADLTRLLSGIEKISLMESNPATVVVPSAPTVADLPGLADLQGDEWAGHAELATVPMAMDEEDDDSLVEREAWLDGLKVGDLCRLMLQGRWVTALLNWRSDNGQFFMFKSRRGSGAHTITRRMLDRLRSEGLATKVEPGQLLARALETMLPSEQ